MSRPNTITKMFFAVVTTLVWLVLLRWVAQDGCLGQGGQVLEGKLCWNGQDPAWQLYSSLSLRALIVNAIAATLAVAILASGLRWVIRQFAPGSAR